jgi:hypothetical protein
VRISESASGGVNGASAPRTSVSVEGGKKLAIATMTIRAGNRARMK